MAKPNTVLFTGIWNLKSIHGGSWVLHQSEMTRHDLYLIYLSESLWFSQVTCRDLLWVGSIVHWGAAEKDEESAEAPSKNKGGLDDNQEEEKKHYRIKLSRWFKAAFHAIKHPLFWFLLHLAHAFRRPLTHFFLFLQKASRNHNEGYALFNVVTHKLSELETEYQVLMANANELIDEALRLSDCKSFFPTDDVEKLRLLGWKLLLQQWSAFRRRLVAPLSVQLVGSPQAQPSTQLRSVSDSNSD